MLYGRPGGEPPAWNLAVDEALLAGAAGRAAARDGHGPATLRFYAWDPPALSIGRFQTMVEAAAAARAAAWPDVAVVRRATGGGAVLHRGELTYAFVAGVGDVAPRGGVRESFAAVHGAVAAGLGRLGLEVGPRSGAADGDGADDGAAARPALCFERASATDLVDGAGRKVVGSAQRRLGRAVLQHGSIPLALVGAGFEAVAAALAEAFARTFGRTAEPGGLRPDEAALARRLEAEKYASAAWTEGLPLPLGEGLGESGR